MGPVGRACAAAPPLAAIGGGWGRKQQPQQQPGEAEGKRFSLPWSKARPAPPPSSSSSSVKGWWPPRLPALRRGGNWAVEELEEYEYEEEEDEGHMLPRGKLCVVRLVMLIHARDPAS